MGDFLGSEAAVNAIVARLQAEIATHVATVNTAHSDGISLTVPDTGQVLDYMPPLEELVPPMVAISDLPATIEDDLGHSFTGVYEFIVAVLDQDPEPAVLARRLRRWERVLALTLLHDTRTIAPAKAGDPGIWGIKLVKIVPGPTLDASPPRDDGSGGPETWLSWRGLQISCRTDET